MDKLILLSFDVEEFDVPEEYGQTLSESVKFKVSAEGLEKVLELLDRLNIKLPFSLRLILRFITLRQCLKLQKSMKLLHMGIIILRFVWKI